MPSLPPEFNPCLDCGLCCVRFRVSFYWGEADDAPGGTVPTALTEKLTPFLGCMRGTNQVPRRCVALAGEPGREVSCTIYPRRPSPCREFPAYLDDATPNPKCDELRAAAGLPPLPRFDPESSIP